MKTRSFHLSQMLFTQCVCHIKMTGMCSSRNCLWNFRNCYFVVITQCIRYNVHIEHCATGQGSVCIMWSSLQRGVEMSASCLCHDAGAGQTCWPAQLMPAVDFLCPSSNCNPRTDTVTTIDRRNLNNNKDSVMCLDTVYSLNWINAMI